MDGMFMPLPFFAKCRNQSFMTTTRCLVSTIELDGARLRAALFSALLSYYLFRDRYGRPGRGNDKGNIEGMVSYTRRNHMAPIPHFPDWKSFNADLEAQCSARQEHILRGHKETIGERLSTNLSAMSPLPATLFDACNHASGRVSSQSLVRYDTNDGAVPVACGHQEA